MLRQEQIAVVLDSQRETFLSKDSELIREILNDIPIVDSYATIITGIRRCGKSTLLLQLLRQKYKDTIYFNFEDIRLAGFDVSDFTRFQSEIEKRGVKVLFLDEIRLIDKWEIFVHQMLREGYSVFITGSNASLLSKELGTHLTGRHISTELFPFSYTEYVKIKDLEYNPTSLESYLKTGGIPEYVKTGNGLLLNSLMDDILIRDIAIRHTVRNVESLRQLAVFLISNTGNLVSANKLTGMFGLSASATILEYFSFFRDAYLIEFLPQFSYSIKAQTRNPKKIYAIDTGLITEISTAFAENVGHKLENLVYLHIRRNYKEIYYYKDKGECDFVIFIKGKGQKAVQVCYRPDDLNFDREYNGLVEAMKALHLKEGTIVTFDQKDRFLKNGLNIELVPAHEYLSRTNPDHPAEDLVR